MLNTQEINNKFISWADSVKAEKSYDMNFVVNYNEFFAFAFINKRRSQEKLVFNLYTNHIQNAPL
jgi:hypothetical protein